MTGMETAAKQQRNTPSRDVDAELGRRAFILMWDRKLKQGELAQRMNIGSDSLGRKLKGERGWALAEIISAAAALNTTVAYLAGETDVVSPTDPDGVGSSTAPANAALAQSVERFTRNE